MTNHILLALLLTLPAIALAVGDDTPRGDAEGTRPAVKMRSRSLSEQWTPSEDNLRMYKQIYYLFYSHSTNPNDTPTSPNPTNQVPYSYQLDPNEMKFQISVKGHMMGNGRTALWFGYTQLSFWQFYDWAHSQPFRENNFEPELILSHRPEDKIQIAGFDTAFVNLAFVHQSNGQILPRSRAWNRAYLQAGLERDLGEGRKLALLPRIWKRLGGGGTDDDNPDITHYLGHGDLELRYQHNDMATLTALLRIRSLQLDLAISSELITPLLHSTNLHLQYFDGYGESLIDYNQRHRTIGIGISMPYE